MIQQYKSQRGFTLIELMLSMSFVAFLLLAIAMTTMQITHIYNKGITLRQVNQAGRALSDELQRSITSAMPFEVTSGSTSRYVAQPGGGRLCVGSYTYAWNYGSAILGGAGAPAIVNTYEGGGDPIRFVKVADSGASLCVDPTKSIERNKASEMLVGGDRDLVLHQFSIKREVNDASIGQALYGISMIIGTNDREQLVTGDTSCKPPSASQASADGYCAVNQFDIIARAGNKAEGNR
jgi:prepilin-type N-terminal cleavage/methylation domain-containing protein